MELTHTATYCTLALKPLEFFVVVFFDWFLIFGSAELHQKSLHCHRLNFHRLKGQKAVLCILNSNANVLI